MDKKFTHDRWTVTFCLVFNSLAESGKITKKSTFAMLVGLENQSTLNHILKEGRNFPQHARQKAMEALRAHFQVNLAYFQDRGNSMFMAGHYLQPDVVENEEEDDTRKGSMTYSEILRCSKIEEENKYLKKLVAEKDRTIETQAALIEVLTAQKPK